jgi:manganese/zinc/iron transport system substrate-binding protein
MKRLIALFIGLWFLLSCSSPQQTNAVPTVVCTTSMVADAVTHLVPKGVEVISLMGPGVDPHLYKATQGDLERLQKADIIVYNGLHLEGKMGDVLEKVGRIKPVIAMAEGVSESLILNPNNDSTIHDPHIWFDLSLWVQGVDFLRTELIKQRPEWSDEVDANYSDFEQDLLAAHNWAIHQMELIPEKNRVLITAHDAFAYFGRAYGLTVKGLQGISTASEFGLKDVSTLVSFISENKVPAVFVESSVPKKSIESVISGCKSRGHQVVLGGQLYSDALGAAGSETSTLIGAFKANVNTIKSGLEKEPNHAE